MEDHFQERYVKHQQQKGEVLQQIVEERHSSRIFSDKTVSGEDIDTLLAHSLYCPSSCNRHAIELSIISDKDLKNLLGGILVGGVGWINRASHIILIFADSVAYKAGDEVKFMPYLDAGIIIHQLYLTSAALRLKCCYVNPNIREMNYDHFKKVFSDKIFCGAFAIGKEVSVA